MAINSQLIKNKIEKITNHVVFTINFWNANCLLLPKGNKIKQHCSFSTQKLLI